MHRIEHSLPWSTPGTERRLTLFAFGQGPRKAYIQAALHADELPGMRVAAELRWRLAELEEAGRLLGRVELVPVANPIGLAQVIQGTHQGRFDFASGRNFNRDFPDLASLVIPTIERHLGQDADHNARLLREAMVDALGQLPPPASLWRACNACCCATPARPTWCSTCTATSNRCSCCTPFPRCGPRCGLAAHLRARVALLAEDSGGFSFDEACAGPWLKLAAALPGHPIPQACVAATLELGGMAETEPDRARHSAEAILAFLARDGFIDGEWPDEPEQDCPPCPSPAPNTPMPRTPASSATCSRWARRYPRATHCSKSSTPFRPAKRGTGEHHRHPLCAGTPALRPARALAGQGRRLVAHPQRPPAERLGLPGIRRHRIHSPTRPPDRIQRPP